MLRKIRAYLAKFHQASGWTENIQAATLWSYEIIRDGKPITKTNPRHNATINSGLNIADKFFIRLVMVVMRALIAYLWAVQITP